MNNEALRLLGYFSYEHLPPSLQAVSKPFAELAHQMLDQLDDGAAETAVMMRKLLEAKDCAVRSALGK